MSKKNKRSKAQNLKKAAPKSIPWIWLAAGAILIGIVAIGAVYLQGRIPASVTSSGGAAPSSGSPAEISVQEAALKRNQGAFILDVREPDEWNDYHIPGATLISLGDLESQLNKIPKDQEIVVVCRSGNRSQAGRDLLLDAGFTQVSSMAGGLKEWRDAGYETVTGP